MKKLLLSLFLISGITYGQGDPAPYIKGQAATGLGNQASTVFVPNQQSTKINAYQARIETGNSNLLVNPSFEATTYNSGWTCSLGSTTLETTAKTDGNKANAINSIGAGVRCYQLSTTNAANLKGLLGSAILKVKTTDSIYKVCGLVDGNAAANERNCITVSPTSTDLPFYPARTDFYMGGTSNGIVVYTTTTTSQPTVIDDAFVGVFNGGISQFSQDTGWSSCGLTTSDFTGFGTVAGIELQCKRDATDLLMRGKFTSGTPTAVEARINLKLNGNILTSAGSLYTPSLQRSGAYDFGIAASASGVMLIEPSVSYSTLGIQSNLAAGISKATGSVVAVNGLVISLNARIPIAGWEANTNAAIAGCVDAKGCLNALETATTTTSGVIDSAQNIPAGSNWLSCTAANPTVCSFIGNPFPNSVPNCYPTSLAPAAYAFRVSSISSSSVSVESYNTTTGNPVASGKFFLRCSKTGTDNKPKTVVVSPLQGYVKVPGAENLNVESFSVSYGTTNATTVCSASPCSYLEQIGSAVTSITVAANIYTINFARTYTEVRCTGNHAGAGVVATNGTTIPQCNSGTCNSVTFNVANSNSGATIAGFGTLYCQGQY